MRRLAKTYCEVASKNPTMQRLAALNGVSTQKYVSIAVYKLMIDVAEIMLVWVPAEDVESTISHFEKRAEITISKRAAKTAAAKVRMLRFSEQEYRACAEQMPAWVSGQVLSAAELLARWADELGRPDTDPARLSQPTTDAQQLLCVYMQGSFRSANCRTI